MDEPMADAVILESRKLVKEFKGFIAVNQVDLQVRRGTIHALIGPNGAGKSTMLQVLAGILEPSAGTIEVRGKIATLLQLGAGFDPALNARENTLLVGEFLGVPHAEMVRRVPSILEFAGLGEFADAEVRTYSSGMRARLGFSVATSVEPDVLLLDEVLSTGDAAFIEKSRGRITELMKRARAIVFVTHDQEEALTMSDRIAIVNRGRIEQLGTPHEVYHRPATPFAASFVGETNLLTGEITGGDGDLLRVRLEGGLEISLRADRWPAGERRALVLIRPEKVHVNPRPAALPGAFEARIEEEIFKGATDHLVLATHAGTRLRAVVANESAHGDILHAGDTVHASLHADDIVVLPA